MLLPFNPESRRVWMFPRNIRNISPWKLHQILKVLMQFDNIDHFSSEDQKIIYQLFEDVGIKRRANTRDKNPGGTRTYFSQLESLGLIFKSKNNEYEYTLAGKAMVDGQHPLNVLQYQLFRHQYPSAYGKGQNVKIDNNVLIKPFMFLMKLLHDDRLERYLTDQDVMIPVIYGHNHDCYEICVEKIIEFRRTNDFLRIVDKPSEDLFTPRGTPDKSLSNIADIANTATNYLRAANLIIKSTVVKKRTSYKFNEMYEDLYLSFLPEYNSFIDALRISNESFQRSYGRYDKEKDNRNIGKIQEESTSAIDMFVQLKFVEFINENPFKWDQLSDFATGLEGYGISLEKIKSAISPIVPKKQSMIENIYLDYAYSGGVKSAEFEKATTGLLINIGFTESKWIGTKKSQKNWRGNFPDIFIKRANSNNCGLGEAKASVSFSLGHVDMLKMTETYMHTHTEIEPSSSLSYVLYIAGDFKGDTNLSLRQLKEKMKIPVTALNAKTMLALLVLKQRGWSAKEIEKNIFLRGGVIKEGVLLNAPQLKHDED